MNDWHREVHRKLADSKLSGAEREEISRELAGFLEDLCSESHSTSAGESSAARATAELHEDPYLGAHLCRARQENNMNDRTKQFWLPAFVVLFTTIVSLVALESAGFSAYFPRAWAGNASTNPFLHNSLMIHLPWLCVLPFLGAAGAWWSRRAGSSRALCTAVGLFPAIVFLATFVVILPGAFAIDRFLPANTVVRAFAGLTLSWVVIPGAALFLGIAPFLQASARRNAA